MKIHYVGKVLMQGFASICDVCLCERFSHRCQKHDHRTAHILSRLHFQHISARWTQFASRPLNRMKDG